MIDWLNDNIGIDAATYEVAVHDGDLVTHAEPHP
jgi:hypothetical protein